MRMLRWVLITLMRMWNAVVGRVRAWWQRRSEAKQEILAYVRLQEALEQEWVKAMEYERGVDNLLTVQEAFVRITARPYGCADHVATWGRSVDTLVSRLCTTRALLKKGLARTAHQRHYLSTASGERMIAELAVECGGEADELLITSLILKRNEDARHYNGCVKDLERAIEKCLTFFGKAADTIDAGKGSAESLEQCAALLRRLECSVEAAYDGKHDILYAPL